MRSSRPLGSVVALALISFSGLSQSCAFAADEATLVLHHGKIVTVDKQFSIHEAMLVRGEKIVQLGTNDEIAKAAGADPHESIDLHGHFVMPGLIDSHTHPNAASMFEFDHEIPDMQTIADVLAYIRERAKTLGEGKWIEVHQVFITRLKEQRYPTRAELDEAAPKNPVLFATGPDASVNTLALKLSGIDKDFQSSGSGYIEKDPQTGEPTGILRNCTQYVKSESAEKRPTEEDRVARLKELFHDYNANGITAIADRDADSGSVERYRRLALSHELSVRVAISQHVDTGGEIESIQQKIRAIAADPLVKGNDFAQIVGIKTYLDGGMLTGSAYMREPWGVSDIYSIRDPHYRGLLFIQPDKLLPIVQTTLDCKLQFTAHSVGDGAVHTLLDAYEQVNRQHPVRELRPCITHCNFMSKEAVEQAARLGVVIDMQPIWLYLDAHTLVKQFGYDRLRYFQPLHSLFAAGVIVGGGSDHMQKIGALRSVNPYHPLLGLATAVTRRARDYEGQLHPEEALTREEALRFYTWNNAYLTFREQQIGSLEPGKLADFVILDRDLLTCEADRIRDAQVLATYVGGQQVYAAEKK